MYAGQIVEMADTATLLTPPAPPLHRRVCCARCPAATPRSRYLTPIPGAPPGLIDPPPGCRFYDRCPLRTEQCRTWKTELLPVGPGHTARCWRHEHVEETPMT